MADLFTPATRSSDPPTSREAAETVTPAVGTIRETVLQFALVRGSSGFIDDDLVRAYCQGSPESSYRKRRSELAQEGLLVDSGRVRTNGYGNNEIVWTHRDFVPAPPPIRSREKGARTVDRKTEALQRAVQLDGFAKTMHAEGRAMFATALRETAQFLRELFPST